MIEQGRRRPVVSLVTVLVSLCGIMAVFVSAGIYYMQLNQSDVMIRQATQVNLDALNAYTDEMDKGFANLEAYMHDFFISNRDIETLNSHADEASRFFGRQSILSTLDQIVRLGGMAESAWIYSPKGDEAEFLSRCVYTGISNAELLNIRDRILDIIEVDTKNRAEADVNWRLVSTNGADYLLWMTNFKDIYYGAWVRLPFIREKFTEVLQHNGGSLAFSTHDGQPLTSSDAGIQLVPEGQVYQAFTVSGVELIGITAYSARADLAITAMLPRSDILSEMRFGFNFALFAAVMIVFVLAVVLVCQYLMYRPFSKLCQALRDIADGDLSLRLKKNSRLKEISTLENSINHLLDVINDLKISVYDTQLRERNVTCQYLQIRLKSHFYLNCLSIIHAMASIKKTGLIMELTECLSNYLRFLDMSADEFIRLEDELEHVRNYTHIQELRYPEMFQYIEEVALELYNYSIPPLILQTFIENSVEHAMKHKRKNWVRLRADYEARKALPGIRFRITDSGIGFDETTLQTLSEETAQLDFSQSHSIGIRNVVSRLALIYDGHATIAFSNVDDGGASIDMWLPIGGEDGELDQ
ncbi:MAG: histidine kinase [Oscillospiraceae bacterium]|nr:histidine kinase [Oscillospiraceae bacterium]